MRLDFTNSEAELLATLAEACDDADPGVKRDAMRVARYLRRRLESSRLTRKLAEPG